MARRNADALIAAGRASRRTAAPTKRVALEEGQKLCPTCGGTFTPKRDWQIYCKDKCRIEKWKSEHITIPKADYVKPPAKD